MNELIFRAFLISVSNGFGLVRGPIVGAIQAILRANGAHLNS